MASRHSVSDGPARTLASVVAPTPIEPPAVIGILGGGQLGRMLGFAARSMGYRVAVLDPDPDCPAAAIAEMVVVGAYDDVEAAMRLADLSAVVTYELEHVAAAVVEALETRLPVRPGHRPLVVTQDRLAERRFVEGAGVAVAPWREVRSVAEARTAAAELGLPLRLKVPIGGYDGRGQIRVVALDELDDAWERLDRAPGTASSPSASSSSRPSSRSSSPGPSTAPSRSSRSPGTCTTPGSWSNRSPPRRSRRRSWPPRSRSGPRWPRRWTCAGR